MHRRAWLVNVSRGGHVDTDALVDALEREAIAGAALDVTDPEPLPDGHRLWSLPNCIITPHDAGSSGAVMALLAARVRTTWSASGPGSPSSASSTSSPATDPSPRHRHPGRPDRPTRTSRSSSCPDGAPPTRRAGHRQ